MFRSLLLVTALLLGSTRLLAEEVELFRDDFGRYPVGPLSRPVGELNPPFRSITTSPIAAYRLVSGPTPSLTSILG
jgi:hypothetical protein